MKRRARHAPIALLAAALLAGCGGGYEPPEEAEPAASAEPLPTDTTFVPGADQPGSQPDAAERTQ
ncbi:MAG TPA: hypothetical protein VHG51_09000 [Longimicrobiaceae bacterium]|nr:hypothetical protein [Longimicrobiaceae bacterium]